jgi:hypothetical protein
MLKRSPSLFTGLCVLSLGLAPLCGCDKTEEHAAAPEAPAPVVVAPPAAPAVDPNAEMAAKAAEAQKQAREARDKAQAAISEQIESLSQKLGELKNKAAGHSKKANVKMKMKMAAAEVQLKQLRDDAKALGESGEDKFVEGKERLQKALAVAGKSVEMLMTPASDKKHK